MAGGWNSYCNHDRDNAKVPEVKVYSPQGLQARSEPDAHAERISNVASVPKKQYALRRLPKTFSIMLVDVDSSIALACVERASR